MILQATRMVATTVIALIAILALAGVSAEEVVERNIAIVLDLGDDAGVIDLDFSPFDMAEGETRKVTSRDGTAVLLSRNNGETVLTTGDGKEIVLPAPGLDPGSSSDHAMNRVEDGSANYEVEVMINLPAEGLMISSSKELDKATRDRIREALKAAGIEQPVNFMEPGKHNISVHQSAGHGQDGEVHIIREERVIETERGN